MLGQRPEWPRAATKASEGRGKEEGVPGLNGLDWALTGCDSLKNALNPGVPDF